MTTGATSGAWRFDSLRAMFFNGTLTRSPEREPTPIS